MKTATGYVIGVDCGTQGVRAGLFDLQGNLIGLARRSYRYVLDRDGHASQDPETVWAAFLDCVRGLVEDNSQVSKDIVGLGVDATSVTLIPCDERGQPLDQAILWMDKRASVEAAEINRSGYPGLRNAGGKVTPEWGLPKVMWLKRHKPEVYNQAHYIVDLVDWLTFRLTGVWKASLCTLITGWNFVRSLGGWDRSFLDRMGIGDLFSKLPPVYAEMGEKVGDLKPQVANGLGLEPGLPVTTAGMDSYASAVGLGITTPNRMTLSLGTSSCYLVQCDEPLEIPGLFGPMSGPIQPRRWAVQGGQSSVASILQWYNTNMVTEEERRESERMGLGIYSWLDRQAERLPPGSGGLVAMDTWHGNRTPLRDPLLTGCIWGLTLHHTKIHVYRAMLESVAYGGRLILDAFRRGGIAPAEIWACGGGAYSDLWLQIHADVLGVPVSRSRIREAAALGAGICAAVGAGAFGDLPEAAAAMVKAADVFRPDPSSSQTYASFFEMYRETCHLMGEMMHRMSAITGREQDE